MTAAPRLALFCAVVLSMSGTAIADTTPPEPAGYRTTAYRSAVPATVNGKAALTTQQAAALWRDHAAVFVDTLPQPPRPAGLPERDDLASETALRHSGQCLAARHRIR